VLLVSVPLVLVSLVSVLLVLVLLVLAARRVVPLGLRAPLARPESARFAQLSPPTRSGRPIRRIPATRSSRRTPSTRSRQSSNGRSTRSVRSAIESITLDGR
jgi:hypothetical protein